MTTSSDIPTAAVDHVSSMLTLAKQKHEEAMAMVGTPDANVAICRNAVTHVMVKSGASYTYLYVDERGEKVGSVVIDKCYNTV